jgi:hypothetical protein
MSPSKRTGNYKTIYEMKRKTDSPKKDKLSQNEENDFQFVSGSKYQGDWVDNKKHGFGVQITSNGNKYEGEFKYDKPDGNGTLWVLQKDKSFKKRYIGGFRNGLKHGNGTYYYQNYDIYVGEFCDGLRCGHGKLVLASGDVFDGMFSNDQLNGEGTVYYKSSGDVFLGTFVGHKREGPGKYFYNSTRMVSAVVRIPLPPSLFT